MTRIGRTLWRQLEFGEINSSRAIWSFAFRVSFRSIIVTSLAGFCSLALLYALDLTSIPFGEMVKLMVVFSWLFGGVLSGGLAFVAGHVIRDLLQSRSEFERLSRTDSLSGLANRRAFNDAFAAVQGEASLAIIDIDRFKSINDRFGHQAGDRVIQSISSVLREVFGEPHVVARLGGEEFGVILQGGTLPQRLVLVEQARRRVAEECVAFHDTQLRVTISVGVAEFRSDKRPETVYAWADKALYLAKEMGRDRVFHEQSLTILDPALTGHAPDDARLFAAIGRRS
ncbi:MAG: GGDEF domain-containing protein [Rhizobium sp.]|nr:GGDEF domain-containing protein [Rhizobium sp.]